MCVSPISSNARRQSDKVRRVTSCNPTTSGSRAATTAAWSPNRDARRATFQVISRATRRSLDYFLSSRLVRSVWYSTDSTPLENTSRFE
jgi:hypothetical protein